LLLPSPFPSKSDILTSRGLLGSTRRRKVSLPDPVVGLGRVLARQMEMGRMRRTRFCRYLLGGGRSCGSNGLFQRIAAILDVLL